MLMSILDMIIIFLFIKVMGEVEMSRKGTSGFVS